MLTKIATLMQKFYVNVVCLPQERLPSTEKSVRRILLLHRLHSLELSPFLSFKTSKNWDIPIF